MWYSQRYLPHLVGKPLIGPKSTRKGNCSISDQEGWGRFAGHPLYNVLNECCLRWNAPGGWGSNIEVTDFAEAQIEQLLYTPEGRAAYASYAKLLAVAVADFPAAIAIELMNEPPVLDVSAPQLYTLYKECYEAIRSVAPDLAVGVADFGSEAPFKTDRRLPPGIRDWLRNTTHLFYAFHCYGCDPGKTVANAVSLSSEWNAATFLTEFGGGNNPTGGAAGAAAAARGVPWTIYQYNGFCNVPCKQGENTCGQYNGTCNPGEPCAFGACIT